MHAYAVRTCFAYSLLAVAFATLPPYIKVCRRNDPDINKCITNSIDQLRNELSKGIPELEVPPLEPLLLQNVRLTRGPVGARLDINLTNLEVYGPSTFKIRDLKCDPDNVVFTYKLLFPKLNFKGKYRINARILLLQLNGEGNLTGTFNNYDSAVLMKANKVIRNNDTYLNFEKMKIAIRIGKSTINLDNLFNGDPVLGPATNEILNSNSDLYLEEVRPVLETALSELFTNVANKITQSFTYDELFPV